MDTTAPVQEGEILAGKYKIERVLAQGGMGVVVAAIHQQLEQRVALKFLLPESMKNESVVGRFLREARAAVRLRSEHVARVLDVGTADTGSPYIVMEYLEGKDLANVLLEEGPLSTRKAVTYVLQASEAVAEAHALGLIHRDLKPANLFLTKRADGSACVKVLDFGISKLQGGDSNLTQTRALMGTPFYMSPEQLTSSRNADVRSDIWALGMILYELLTGSVAFERDTLPELCTAILNAPVPSLLEKRPELAPELCAIIERALAKRPADRHSSLAELAAALAPFCPRGADSAQRIRRVLDGRAQNDNDGVLASIAPPLPEPPLPELPREKPSTPLVLAGGGVLVAIGIVLAAIAFLPRSSAKPARAASTVTPIESSVIEPAPGVPAEPLPVAEVEPTTTTTTTAPPAPRPRVQPKPPAPSDVDELGPRK